MTKSKIWSQSLENLVSKYIELCVELKKGKKLKEGLTFFRNTCQNTSNFASLEIIIRRFIDISEKKLQEAQSKTSAAIASSLPTLDQQQAGAIVVAEEDEDVELEGSGGTESSSFFAAIAGDSRAQAELKEKQDRELVAPSIKFLWESYRTIIDLIRNNSKLESVYQAIAFKAFDFCVKYQRRADFRRLCDILRNNLVILIKFGSIGVENQKVTIANNDTFNCQIEIRFKQLELACNFGLWLVGASFSPSLSQSPASSLTIIQFNSTQLNSIRFK